MTFGAVSNRRIDAATSYLEVPKLLQSSSEASRYQWVRVKNVHLDPGGLRHVDILKRSRGK
jgi:hypothetical protein